MLDIIHIENFKSFDNEEIQLKKINLFTGKNSSGKSSAIQAILLLAHNIEKALLIKQNIVSPITSYKFSLGSFNEIRNFIKNAQEIIIGIKKEQEETKLRITNFDDHLEANFICESSVLKELFKAENNKIHYLSANRIGAQDLYLKNINNYEKFGSLGEFAIDYYNEHENNILDNSLIKNKSLKTLRGQVNYWLNYILGCNIFTETIDKSDKIRTTFSIVSKKQKALPVRPQNIGSGISYIISILIMCLASEKNDVIIIENPEIHLHPKAQAFLTEFFVFIANAGIQLIIETHSDHIFNGLRKSIYKSEINQEDVAVSFFNLNDETLCTEYTKINFDNKGKILTFPNGLFDQFDEDLNVLLGLE